MKFSKPLEKHTVTELETITETIREKCNWCEFLYKWKTINDGWKIQSVQKSFLQETNLFYSETSKAKDLNTGITSRCRRVNIPNIGECTQTIGNYTVYRWAISSMKTTNLQ